MSSPESPSFYCWNGNTKVATAWTPDLEEANLCPPQTNCSIYLSHDQSQQQPPSFSIRFDQLVTKQCQPLLKTLFYDTPPSAENTNALQNSLSGQPLASTQRLSASSSCILILPPPSLVDEDQALQYNITTRNFFAWILGAPVVGTDPTHALIALKLRMDIWRDSSTDNVAAIRQYAGLQGYTEPNDLHLCTELDLQSSTSPAAAEYRLASAPVSNFSRSTFHASARLRKSLGKRAGAILKRKSDKVAITEDPQFKRSPSQIRASLPEPLASHPVLLSEISLENAGSLPSINVRHARSTSSVTINSDDRSESNTSSKLSIPSSLPAIPALDSIVLSACEDDGVNDKSDEVRTKSSQVSPTSSTRQSPAKMESPRARTGPSTRRPTHKARRRAFSQSGAAPPSTIPEDATMPSADLTSAALMAKKRHSRRYSFDTGADHLGHHTRSVNDTVTASVRQSASSSTSNLPASRSHVDRIDQTHNVCATCKRRKKPYTLPLGATATVTTPSTHIMTIEPDSTITNSATSAHADGMSTPASTFAPAPEEKEEMESRQDHLRFPNPYGISEAAHSNNASTESNPQSEKVEHISTLKPSELDSQSPVARPRSSTMSKTVPLDPNFRSGDFDAAHLFPAGHACPAGSGNILERQASCETTVTTSSESSEAMATAILARLTELTLAAEFTEVEKLQGPVTSPSRALSVKTVAPPQRPQSLIRVTSPEPADFAVLMKSNGRTQALALMLEDEKTCMTLSSPMSVSRSPSRLSTACDDTILLDRLLEGFQYLQHPPETDCPQIRSKTPNQMGSTFLDASLSPALSSQLSLASPTSNASLKSSRRSYASSLKRWRSRDTTLVDESDFLPDSRSVGKHGQLQMRVLTMDSSGKFITQFMDSPVEMDEFTDFH